MTPSKTIEMLRGFKEPTLAFLWRGSKGERRKGQRLGVFSGSFNPPTIAHERLCQIAQKTLGLEEVLLLLAIVNVDKPLFGFSLEERIEMMVALAKSHEGWSAAVCNHGRFVEKAQAILKVYPRGTKLWFLVGYDTLVRVFESRFYPDRPMEEALRELFSVASFAVASRGEAGEEVVRAFLCCPEVQPFAPQIFPLPVDPSIRWISSTQVRKRLGEGKPVGAFVPPSVLPLLKPSPTP